MCGVWATLSGGLGCPRPQASRAGDDQARSLEAKRKWQNPQKRSAFSLSSIGRHSHENGQEWKQNPTSRLSDNDGQFTSRYTIPVPILIVQVCTRIGGKRGAGLTARPPTSVWRVWGALLAGHVAAISMPMESTPGMYTLTPQSQFASASIGFRAW